MTKQKFLTLAKKKYKEQIEKEWMSEMNFIYDSGSACCPLILRVWFDHTIDNHKGAFCHRWCTVEKL